MRIKGILFAILVVLFLGMPTFAGYVDSFTQDETIRSALVLLEKVGAKEVFNNLDENSVKITFYDLSQISAGYMNHFAVNTVDSFGNRYILINTKFKNASPEEIACLIAHESFHKLSVATYEEEYIATTKEAEYWQLLKNHNKQYKNSALLSRLDNLSTLRTASTAKNNLIESKINKSNFYKRQLKHSDLSYKSTPNVPTTQQPLPSFDTLVAAR